VTPHTPHPALLSISLFLSRSLALSGRGQKGIRARALIFRLEISKDEREKKATVVTGQMEWIRTSRLSIKNFLLVQARKILGGFGAMFQEVKDFKNRFSEGASLIVGAIKCRSAQPAKKTSKLGSRNLALHFPMKVKFPSSAGHSDPAGATAGPGFQGLGVGGWGSRTAFRRARRSLSAPSNAGLAGKNEQLDRWAPKPPIIDFKCAHLKSIII